MYQDNVIISSHARNHSASQHKDAWLSCFTTAPAHEFFSLRRYYGLFGCFLEGQLQSPVDVEIEEAYYGGVLFPFFGHFLIESLSMLPNIPAGETKIVFSLLGNKHAQWQWDFLELLGVAHRVVLTSSDVRIKVGRLFRVEQTAVIKSGISRELIDYCSHVVPRKAVRGPKYIYLSRRRIVNAPSKNEEELERRLSLLGFVIISPELYSAADQVSLVARAEVIVALEGSALHSLIFNGNRKTKIMILKRRESIGVNFVKQFAVQPELDVSVIDCMSAYAKGFKDESVIDVDRAILELEKELDRAGIHD
jgi:capsular polysaccharide biosynthesis protein